MRPSSIAAVLATVALGVAGCGGDDDGGGGSANTSGYGAPARTGTAPTATTPSAGRSAVTLSATEFSFSPANVDVKAGETTFRLRNDGGAPHALEIEGKGVEEKTAVIDPGGQATLKVDLKPGTYEMYCPVDDHRGQGMEGKLTVS